MEPRKLESRLRRNIAISDSKVHGANMGPTWGRQDPGGPHVGHMNLAIWDVYVQHRNTSCGHIRTNPRALNISVIRWKMSGLVDGTSGS